MATPSRWRRAPRLPIVIDTAATTAMTGCQESSAGPSPRASSTSSAPSAADFDTEARKPATMTLAPRYVSGTQTWNGTAPSLNSRPTMVSTTPTETTAPGTEGAASSRLNPA
jgi:hypothetical protein